jgi:transposase-like protein
MEQVPVIMLAGLTEPQKRALRLADNKIALNAGWDIEILKLELTELSLPEFEIDLSLTGFASGEIDVVLGSKVDPDDEVIPEVPSEPRTRMGDIWQLGEHRIGCGDGRDVAFLRQIIGEDAAIDAAFLDPPYNVKINGHADVPPVFSSSLSESFPVLWSLRARSWNMKKSRYTDEQIAFAMKQAETGTPVAEVIRRMGISEQTFYRWKKVYGGLGVGELRRLKQLEDENRQLKQLVADLSLDKHILQDVLSKKL